MKHEKIGPQHLERKAILYVRQSSAHQVLHNRESSALQYAMRGRLSDLGWSRIETVDDDLGRSAAGGVAREGFDRMIADVCLGKVGAVAAREVSRFARNSRDWQHLIEMCRVVDTVLIDQETVYAPRDGNDRLLLGLKGSLNEYELDLLRQRSLAARQEKARRGELVVAAPVGFVKAGDRLEKDPDRRVQEAISLAFDKVAERLGWRSKVRDGRSDQRADARHRHQAARHVVFLGPAGDLGIRLDKLCLQLGQGRNQHIECGEGIGWQAAFRVFGDCNQLRRVGRPLWGDLSELAQMPSQCIDGLGPLPDQKLMHAEHHRRTLRLFALHRHKAHRRTQRGLADRLGIGCIIFLVFDKGLHLGGWDEPYIMAQLADLTTPEMSAATGFHRENTGLQPAEEGQHLTPPQLLAQNRLPRSICPRT